MRKGDIRNYEETESENSRTVKYDSYVDGKVRAHITVHIPKRSAAEQAEYEKNVRAALRRFYHHVTVERGCNWDELVAKYSN